MRPPSSVLDSVGLLALRPSFQVENENFGAVTPQTALPGEAPRTPTLLALRPATWFAPRPLGGRIASAWSPRDLGLARPGRGRREPAERALTCETRPPVTAAGRWRPCPGGVCSRPRARRRLLRLLGPEQVSGASGVAPALQVRGAPPKCCSHCPVPAPPSRSGPERERQAPHSRQASLLLWPPPGCSVRVAAAVAGRVLSLLWPAHAGPGGQWGPRVGGGGPGQAPWDCTWAKEDKGLQGSKRGVSFLCRF